MPELFLLLKSLIILTAVLLLAYGVLRLLKAYAPKESTSSRIRVMESKRLDARSTLFIVGLDDKELIVVTHTHGVAVEGMQRRQRSDASSRA